MRSVLTGQGERDASPGSLRRGEDGGAMAQWCFEKGDEDAFCGSEERAEGR